MRFDVEYVIYAYVFVCASLLLYNFIYIFRSKGRNQRLESRSEVWSMEIEKQMELLEEGEEVEENHQSQLRKKLVRTDALLTFGIALDKLSHKAPDLLNRYVQANEATLQFLASKYAKKESMDRAYFAYLISRHWYCGKREFRPIMEILITFLDDSTIYCRENVLNALYSLGNSQAVENALQVLNDRGWFHHQKLLSDGLLTFTGNKEELADRLWGHRQEWDMNIMLSVIQFITGFSEKYKEKFFPVLNSQDVDLEIKLALLRYYRRHVYEPVRPLLFSYLSIDNKEDSLSIVAASVLVRYPGKDTRNTLKRALSHSNWYVRYNCAASLVELGCTEWEMKDILNGKDRYAKEILVYMLEEKKAGVST